MWSKKNLSPKELSAFTALVLSLPIGLGIGLLQQSWRTGLVSLVIIFLGSYVLVLSIIQRFIYRKIKLIYKFIHQTKASKKQAVYNQYILPKKSIDEVREDVEAWAAQRSREVETLQQNETFRKEFLQNLTHEFKTPVFAIQGYVDTLLNGALEDPGINRAFLQKAARNVDRLVSLMQDLDEITRLERGELQLHRKPFVVQELVREVFESLAWKADARSIHFSLKKGCEKPLTVVADREKIGQVLTNLVDNAVKYGKQNGQVVASMYRVDEKTVLVEISDNGTGISEKYLDRVFERFFRATEGRSRDAGGSGLGLAICKHIVEAHGQTIHVRSKEGIGSTFGFTLTTGGKA